MKTPAEVYHRGFLGLFSKQLEYYIVSSKEVIPSIPCHVMHVQNFVLIRCPHENQKHQTRGIEQYHTIPHHPTPPHPTLTNVVGAWDSRGARVEFARSSPVPQQRAPYITRARTLFLFHKTATQTKTSYPESSSLVINTQHSVSQAIFVAVKIHCARTSGLRICICE